MSSTVQNIIDRVRRDIVGVGRHEFINQLSAALTDTTTSTLSFKYGLGMIQPGALLSIGTEDMYVLTSDQTSNTATVVRGVESSTAATHTTTDFVRCNARLTDAQIFRAINDAVHRLNGDGLFRINVAEWTWQQNQPFYEFATNVNPREVGAVWFQYNPAIQDWKRADGWEYTPNLNDGLNFGVTGSGAVIFFRRDVGTPGFKAQVQYLTDLPEFVAVTDVVTNDVQSAELWAVACSVSLTEGRETSRNSWETGQSARATQDVPAGASLGAFRGLEARYRVLVNAEKSRLFRLWMKHKRRK